MTGLNHLHAIFVMEKLDFVTFIVFYFSITGANRATILRGQN
jgi:hypothetical protein